MATLSARRYSQLGSSLVEMMVGSLLGIVILGVISSVFLSFQRAAKEKSLELHLQQQLSIALVTLKEDIQRAGYDGGKGFSLKLSGADETIQVSGGTSIGLAYFREGSRENKDFRSIKYMLSGKKLLACEKGVVSKAQVVALSDISPCASLFDEDLIEVSHFSMSSAKITDGAIESAVTSIKVSLQTADGAYSETGETSFKQRNWQ